MVLLKGSVLVERFVRGALTTWSCQRGYQNCPSIPQLTFLMPSGFRCKATSFSGLTTGMLGIMLHVILQVEGECGVARVRKMCEELTMYFQGLVFILRLL